MGLKFVNKGSVIVDCRSAMRNGMSWTLVNNCTGERMYCQTGVDAVERLRDNCKSVQDHLDELRKAGEQEKEKDDGFSERIFFVDIDDAPALLNLLDASDHVKAWDATRNGPLSHGERDIVRIEYTSDRQLLFQEEEGKVVFRDERRTRDELAGMRLVEPPAPLPLPGGERSGDQGLKEKEGV